MTTNNGNRSSVEAQEHKDAWAYLALGEKVPQPTAPNTSSSQSPSNSSGEGQLGTEGKGGEGGDHRSGEPTAKGANPVTGSVNSDLTLDDLLKDPKLGPLLNSWNDRTVNSRFQSERTRLERELEPVYRARFEEEETRTYLTNLSDEQRGLALSQDPKLATAWADMVKERQSNTLAATPEAVATAAQVYALAAQIRTYNDLINESALPPEAKAALLDNSKYESEGPQGVVTWGKDIQRAIIAHEKETGIKAELDTRWQSLLEDQKGHLPQRPGLIRPGTRQLPVADIVDGGSDEFLGAFR